MFSFSMLKFWRYKKIDLKGEGETSLAGHKDEKKEELLRQAIALSEENFQENDVEELLRELEAWKWFNEEHLLCH